MMILGPARLMTLTPPHARPHSLSDPLWILPLELVQQVGAQVLERFPWARPSLPRAGRQEHSAQVFLQMWGLDPEQPGTAPPRPQESLSSPPAKALVGTTIKAGVHSFALGVLRKKSYINQE